MSWAQYHQAHMRGVEAAEAEESKLWAAVLLALKRWESWIQERVANRVAAHPMTEARGMRGGRFDTSNRQRVKTYRRGIETDVAAMERGIRAEVLGQTDEHEPGSPVRRTLPRAGLAMGAFLATSKARGSAWRKMSAIASVDSGEKLWASAPSVLVQEDNWEVVQDAWINIIRNVRDKGERLREDIIRMSGRSHLPADVLALANGWRHNRGHMRLATTAHVRSISRKGTLTDGTRNGITSYRLDIPDRWHGRVAPGSELGKELWRVRTLDEWERVFRRVNRGRLTSSSFGTLGLNYNDRSYITPVPAIYLIEAAEHGAGLIARFLRGAKKSIRRVG